MTRKKPFTTYRHFLRDEGGATAACIIFPEENKAVVGFSFCSPEEHQFSRSEGRKHAKKRLLENPIELDISDGIVKACIEFLKFGGWTSSDFRFKLYKHQKVTRITPWIQGFVDAL
jgi:hypothetical protein